MVILYIVTGKEPVGLGTHPLCTRCATILGFSAYCLTIVRPSNTAERTAINFTNFTIERGQIMTKNKKQGTSAPKNGTNGTNGSTVELYGIDVIDWKNPEQNNKESLLKTCRETIDTVLYKQEGLASKLGQALYIMQKEELYKEEGYTSTAKWAESEYGLSKSSVSEALKVYSRFGTRYGIADKYRPYNYSCLIKMAGFTDEELDFMGINPAMSRAQIVTATKEKKQLEDKLKNLSDEERSTVEQSATLKEAQEAYDRAMDSHEKAKPASEEELQAAKEAREEAEKKIIEKMDAIKPSHEKEEDALQQAIKRTASDAEKFTRILESVRAYRKTVEDNAKDGNVPASSVLSMLRGLEQVILG